MADIENEYDVSADSELIKALVRVLEKERPTLRADMVGEMEAAADHYEASDQPKRAAAMREIAALAFLRKNRNSG